MQHGSIAECSYGSILLCYHAAFCYPTIIYIKKSSLKVQFSKISKILPYDFLFSDDGSAPRFKRPIIAERFAVANDTMKFACKVRGSPRPYVLFYYEGEPVSLDNDRYDNPTLVPKSLNQKTRKLARSILIPETLSF